MDELPFCFILFLFFDLANGETSFWGIAFPIQQQKKNSESSCFEVTHGIPNQNSLAKGIHWQSLRSMCVRKDKAEDERIDILHIGKTVNILKILQISTMTNY